MIENSDRGITLNKSLAWSLASGLVAAGLWLGVTVTSLQSATEALSAAIADLKDDLKNGEQRDTAAEGRMRALENGATRIDVQFSNLTRSLEEVKQAQAETNDLLRTYLQEPRK